MSCRPRIGADWLRAIRSDTSSRASPPRRAPTGDPWRRWKRNAAARAAH